MTLDTFIILFATGFVCGAINAISGGSSLISFPVLISTGLSPNVANASNFLATLPGYAAAIPHYRKEFRKMKAFLLPLSLAALLGAGTGACLLLFISASFFFTLTPYLLLSATLLYALGNSIHGLLVKHGPHLALKEGNIGRWLIYLFSIYGGFFGAGMGIIMFSILRILGFRDFHQANALKNLMISIMSLLSLALFIAGGLIAWPEALSMMLGATLGGYQMVKYLDKVPQAALHWLIILFGLGFSTYYFLQNAA